MVLDRLTICAVVVHPLGTVDVSGVARLIRRNRVLLLVTLALKYGHRASSVSILMQWWHLFFVMSIDRFFSFASHPGLDHLISPRHLPLT
jgi:hypothetical protein